MTEQSSEKLVSKLINIPSEELKIMMSYAMKSDYLTYGNGGMKLFLQDYFTFCANKRNLLEEFINTKRK